MLLSHNLIQAIRVKAKGIVIIVLVFVLL